MHIYNFCGQIKNDIFLINLLIIFSQVVYGINYQKLHKIIYFHIHIMLIIL